MNAGSQFRRPKLGSGPAWRISFKVIRFWTSYEVKEVRHAEQILGYMLFLRRTAITDHCDCSFSFEQDTIIRHGIPCREEQLQERRSDGYPKYINCFSTADKALNAAALHHFLKHDDLKTSNKEGSNDDIVAA